MCVITLPNCLSSDFRHDSWDISAQQKRSYSIFRSYSRFWTQRWDSPDLYIDTVCCTRMLLPYKCFLNSNILSGRAPFRRQISITWLRFVTGTSIWLFSPSSPLGYVYHKISPLYSTKRFFSTGACMLMLRTSASFSLVIVLCSNI